MPRLMPLTLLALALAGLGAASAQADPNTDRPPGATAAPQSTAQWEQLPRAQQAALRPLAAEWDTLGDAHRRKWLVLARNFGRMNADEQATLHSRMAQWTALSPRERSRARLNFAEIQQLAPSDERKAKWEAYRALSDDERKALADRAAATPRGAVLPLRPVPESRLAPVPPSALRAAHGGPRITLTPPAAASEPASEPAPPAAAMTPMQPVAPEPLADAEVPATLQELAPPDMAAPLLPASP